MLLLIDFYEKTAISSKRRAQMTKVCVVGRLFAWWDIAAFRKEQFRRECWRALERVHFLKQFVEMSLNGIGR